MLKKQPKFYRVLSMNKSILNNSSYQSVSPQKLTQSIVKNKHYVYIDVNSQNGLCEMQQINPQDADQDAEMVAGNNYLCGIARLPQQSQKTIDYVYKLQQFKKQKQKFKQLLRDQINKTVQKINASKSKKKQKNKNYKSLDKKNRNTQQPPKTIERDLNVKPSEAHTRNLSTIGSSNRQQNLITQSYTTPNKNVIMYRGMQTKHLRQFLQQKQLQNLNAQILAKQKLLIAKYGFTNQFESITKQKSHIVRKNRKIILPEIKSQPKFNF